MDNRYVAYCLADRHFYEPLDRLPDAVDRAPFEAAGRPVPEGWASFRSGDWLHLVPGPSVAGAEARPAQGWKIHVSATAEDAEKTARDVWDYCVPRAIPFKFVPTPHQLLLRNGKYAGRDGSGKFMTVYPSGEDRLHTILTELHAIVGGRPGPYVLTDLRWQEGPLYVRYGAFAPRRCADEHGDPVPAIEDDQGRLVPDHRAPVFHVPAWVTLPPFLRPQLAARNATTLAEMPYRVEKALHYSNGGGVYRATDTRDGRTVVLKEARAHAGLAIDGSDAVARLEREKAALERLAGLGVAPAGHDWFTVGDHRFLAMEFVEGRTLNSCFAERHPLLSTAPDPSALTRYTRWALEVHQAVEKAVAVLHSRQVCFNDLHMFNIMVEPDERTVRLLDFEAATLDGERGRQVLAHPGFLAPRNRTGTEVDRYALACLRLALFLPVTMLLAMDRSKADHLAEIVSVQFPEVPAAFLAEAVAEITRDAEPAPPTSARPTADSPRPTPSTRRTPLGWWSRRLPEPGDWPRSRDSMVRAILSSATPDRDDRLFPGDIAQFTAGGGLGLAHGAAGVLHALAETGAGRYETGEQWLLDHTDPPPPRMPPGLYDGLAGVILTLDRLGHQRRALTLTETLLGTDWERLPSDLHGGLSGIGLVLDHLAHTTGHSGLHGPATRIAELLADRLAAAEREQGAVRPRAGLLHGATGPALFFLRRYEHLGDPALLDLAHRALRRDLTRCVRTARNALQVDEGWRTMPYLGAGSLGIGAVLDDYLVHAPERREELAETRSGILLAASSRFYVQSGLFQGLAGVVWYLARTTTPGLPPGELAAQTAALGWYRMDYRGATAFPGHQNLRLSMDLATGTAGCLLALGAALGDRAAHLPFLPPRQDTPAAAHIRAAAIPCPAV
ncbi:class III lanthionine synthetase LanKC [Streptomyces palmae]|uniref:Lantipeptide synthetase n=1 Tax=Streptomyces palmae TaxID=1701085 RepID=A0A4Z0H969_9ACTN|nr:class III lanthionine synthetase LanKC [Streptomyces palmae]TGB06055.1 lantipeptide synthetase [Streptomyces palmae]